MFTTLQYSKSRDYTNIPPWVHPIISQMDVEI